MNIKWMFGIVLVIMAVTLMGSSPIPAQQVQLVQPGVYLEKMWEPVNAPLVVVYYFHGNKRCKTCLAIEAQTLDTIKKSFKDQLKDKKLAACVLNVEKPEYEHFNEDFQLVTRSVILALYNGNELVAWKNLDKIWNLVWKEDAFNQYIHDETVEFLNSAATMEMNQQ